jgi:hypothetical protein
MIGNTIARGMACSVRAYVVLEEIAAARGERTIRRGECENQNGGEGGKSSAGIHVGRRTVPAGCPHPPDEALMEGE